MRKSYNQWRIYLPWDFLQHEVTELKLKVGNSTAVYGLSYGKPLLRARWVVYFVLIRHRSQSSHLLRHPTPVFKANFSGQSASGCGYIESHLYLGWLSAILYAAFTFGIETQELAHKCWAVLNNHSIHSCVCKEVKSTMIVM